jgi:hypothetical protein
MSEEIKKVATTPEHFKVFKEEFLRWRHILGLTDWEILFKHTSPPEDSRAYVGYTTMYRCATVFLSPIWKNFDEPLLDAQVRKAAFHEACELLLARLNILAQDRYLREGEITEAIHEVIRVLENVLFWRDHNERHSDA